MTPPDSETIARVVAGLPRSAILGLVNHPGGDPVWWDITQAAGRTRDGKSRQFRHVVKPLIDGGLVDVIRKESEDGKPGWTRHPLTSFGLAVRALLADGGQP